MIADPLLCAPASTFADERTITDVTGRPPIMPETMLPPPCAINSQFLSVVRRCGSSSSTAFTLNSDSRLATIASVSAVTHTALLPIAVKSGSVNRPTKPEMLSATGTWTRCVGSRYQLGMTPANTRLRPTPISTATSGPGKKRSTPSLGRAPSHQNRKTRLMSAMTSAPGWMPPVTPRTMSLKVLPPFEKNSKLPSKSPPS